MFLQISVFEKFRKITKISYCKYNVNPSKEIGMDGVFSSGWQGYSSGFPLGFALKKSLGAALGKSLGAALGKSLGAVLGKSLRVALPALGKLRPPLLFYLD